MFQSIPNTIVNTQTQSMFSLICWIFIVENEWCFYLEMLIGQMTKIHAYLKWMESIYRSNLHLNYFKKKNRIWMAISTKFTNKIVQIFNHKFLAIGHERMDAPNLLSNGFHKAAQRKLQQVWFHHTNQVDCTFVKMSYNPPWSLMRWPL